MNGSSQDTVLFQLCLRCQLEEGPAPSKEEIESNYANLWVFRFLAREGREVVDDGGASEKEEVDRSQLEEGASFLVERGEFDCCYLPGLFYSWWPRNL